MNTSIFIPKRINVGYQKRNDTYTGKLAYVTYFDEKGTLRKQKSWENWKDESIPNTEFDNVPTEGFVLNKNVGGCPGVWDQRQAYCRIYDPRDFEFEITIKNLLYILENTNSIKGKGLEGTFVYGWNGNELVLIPTSAPNYKEFLEYTKNIFGTEDIQAKDLILGARYLMKNGDEVVYMGRHDTGGWIQNEDDRNWADYGDNFWFAKKVDLKGNGESEWDFIFQKTVPKAIIKCLDVNTVPEYSVIYEKMLKHWCYSPCDRRMDRFERFTLEEFIELVREVVKTKGEYEFLIKKNSNYHYGICAWYKKAYLRVGEETVWIREKSLVPIVRDFYEKYKPGYLQKYLPDGTLYMKICYQGK